MRQHRLPKRLIGTLFWPSVLVVLSTAGIVMMQYPEIQASQGDKTENQYVQEEQEQKLQLSLLAKTPAMGFSNLLADWVYLQYIQYFGDSEARKSTGYVLVRDYFREVVQRDPFFIKALLIMEVGNSLFAGQAQSSVELLSDALQKIPPKFITNDRPYYLWRVKGNDELLFLGDVEAAKASYQKSEEWAEVYDDEDSRRLVRINQSSLAFLNKNPDSKMARVGAWVSVLSNSPDRKTSERAIEEIRKLGGIVTINPNGTVNVSVPDAEDW